MTPFQQSAQAAAKVSLLLLLAVVVAFAIAAATQASAEACGSEQTERRASTRVPEKGEEKGGEEKGGEDEEEVKISPGLISNLTASLRQAQARCGWRRPADRRSDEAAHRIAGGYRPVPGEFPSYVQVYTNFGNVEQNCGGTIISPWLVLSAQHCFQKDNQFRFNYVTIYAGSIWPKTGARYTGGRLCMPAGAVQNYNLDIALFILDRPIQFNQYVQPACLPSFDVRQNMQGYVVGMGYVTKNPYPTNAAVLQALPVIKSNYCPLITGPTQTCFVSNDPRYVGDACEGDSGGPVYADFDGQQTVIAVVSRGINRCQPGLKIPGVYMNVFRLNQKILSCPLMPRPNNAGTSIITSSDDNEFL